MVVVFCCVLFRTWNVIWIVWYTMREWREVELTPGKELSIRLYSGVYNDAAIQEFEYWNSFASDIISMGIPNTDGLNMSVKKVELIVKERDLEYNLEFCDIFVTGTIL